MIPIAALELLVPLIFKHIPMATYDLHPINQTARAKTEFNVMLLGWCLRACVCVCVCVVLLVLILWDLIFSLERV